jgi:uncharacterized protein (TIGR00725 family)
MPSQPPRIPIIAVVGPGDERDPTVLASAEQLGRLIADRGWTLVTGGKGGVMEAASRGAASAGGRIIAILPEATRDAANPHVEVAIATGLGESRNVVIATCCDGMIVLGGGYGALSEVAFALKLGTRVIALASPWQIVPGVKAAESAEEAVRSIVQQSLTR